MLARRYDCEPNNKAFNERFAQSFVLFSDDQGATWTAGERLAEGWTECQVAELRNGSLLLTARMAGAPWLSKPGVRSDRRRGFARSDDGGATWAAFDEGIDWAGRVPFYPALSLGDEMAFVGALTVLPVPSDETLQTDTSGAVFFRNLSNPAATWTAVANTPRLDADCMCADVSRPLS